MVGPNLQAWIGCYNHDLGLPAAYDESPAACDALSGFLGAKPRCIQPAPETLHCNGAANAFRVV